MQMKIVGYLDKSEASELSHVCYCMKSVFSNFLCNDSSQTSRLVNLAIETGRIKKVIEFFKEQSTVPISIECKSYFKYSRSEFIQLLDCFPNSRKLTIPFVFSLPKRFVYFESIQKIVGMISLMSSFSSLRPLPTQLNDNLVKMALMKCQGLCELLIPCAMKLTSEVFNDILEQPSIKSLHIDGGNNLTSHTVEALSKKFTGLRRLSLESCKCVQFKDGIHSKAFRNLKVINLAVLPKFGDKDLAVLVGSCTKLRQISIRACSITTAGLINLANVLTLRKVCIIGDDSYCRDRVLKKISKKCSNIIELDLRCSRGFTDAGIQSLARLEHLKKVMLFGTNTTIASLGQVELDRDTQWDREDNRPAFARSD